MNWTTRGRVQCRVRSGTPNPCRRPATARIQGIPFCEPCAREQDAYFTIGELTEEPRNPGDDGQLARLLARMRLAKRFREASAGGPEVHRDGALTIPRRDKLCAPG
ncbi:MAG TPA: hypothetical protein VE225_01370 [Rubrobacteraceae bacterium]|nr:hypothetical protein [Rubrobacteraceae bacterium]